MTNKEVHPPHSDTQESKRKIVVVVVVFVTQRILWIRTNLQSIQKDKDTTNESTAATGRTETSPAG